MKGKRALVKGKWVWVELTQEETQKLMDNLLKFNYEELKRIVEFLRKNPIQGISQDLAVKLLFDKQATASYTVFSTALDMKVETLNKEAPKETPKELPKKAPMLEEKEKLKKEIEEQAKKIKEKIKPETTDEEIKKLINKELKKQEQQKTQTGGEENPQQDSLIEEYFEIVEQGQKKGVLDKVKNIIKK